MKVRAARSRRLGSVGGSADEAGGHYRRSVAALFAAYGLNGLPFEGLPCSDEDAVVVGIALEAPSPVDDVLVQLSKGRLFIQAKRCLRFDRTMREVTRQFLDAIRDADFRMSEDILAAVSGSQSEAVRDLASALERRRSGGTIFSSAETKALDTFHQFLAAHGATRAETDVIATRTVILALGLESGTEGHAERGRLLLDGRVVQPNCGARAWRELLAIAGRAARLRLGHRIEDWLEQLRNRQVPLMVDVQASRAAYFEARQQAVDRYRLHLQQRGDHVDLAALGSRVPPIPLDAMDAHILVYDPHASERHYGELFWAMLRRGRVVLTGLPGGGKTTALAETVSRWSRRDDLPIPISVSLRRIAEKDRFRRVSLRDNLLELAVEELDAADRSLVKDFLAGELRNGRAALFLDGLDEAATRRLDLVSDIRRLLDDVPEDVDVLLVTRDVAYADAQLLGFADLRLTHPDQTTKMVAAVLQAVATQRQVDGADAWMATRVDWISDVLEQDPQISQTPLMPVLLALLAVDKEADELPRTRSTILADVVRNVVRMREIRRGIRLSGIETGDEAAVMEHAFSIVASVLSEAGGSAPQSQLVDSLTRYLQQNWNVKGDMACETARQVLTFWDESGIFPASGSNKVVAPPLRIFLEIGTALGAAARPDKARTWVGAAALEPTSRETLILAAGLSQPIADALIAHACRTQGPGGDSLALAAAVALGEGGSASDFAVLELVKRLLPLVEPGDADAWAVVEALTGMPVPGGDQARVVQAFARCFSTDHATVSIAAASLGWGWPDEQRDDWIVRALRIRSLSPLPYADLSAPPDLTRRQAFADRLLSRVAERGAATLLTRRPHLAPIVAEAVAHCSVGTADVLDRLLRRHGQEVLATQAEEKRWPKIKESDSTFLTEAIERIDANLTRMLETVASLAEPAALTPAQSRRLDELGKLLRALNYDEIMTLMEPDPILSEGGFVFLLAALGGMNRAVLAAEAQIVQRQRVSAGFDAYLELIRLAHNGEPAALVHWPNACVGDLARGLLVDCLRGRPDVASVAARALSTHPDRPGTATLIEQELPRLPAANVRPAVAVLLRLSSDVDAEEMRLAHSSNTNVRLAVASLFRPTRNGHPTNLCVRLLEDPVRQVRLTVLRALRREAQRPTPELLSLLRRASGSPDEAFACGQCGTSCRSSDECCSSCRAMTERPSELARDILADVSRGHPEPQ